MTEQLTDIDEFDLPYRRKARLRRVDFDGGQQDGGMSMVRLILREGTRITQVDLDAASATRLGQALTAAARDL